VEDKRIVHAESYKIETQIGGNDHLTAKADLQMRAVVAGERVLKFGLLPTLRVSAVHAGGQSVPFIQEDRKHDGGLYVILPEATTKDQDYRLTFEYSGDKVLEKAGGGNFAVGARTSWYPNVNAFKDQATYELIFKVPRQYTLVSVGKPMEQTREGNLTVTRWVSEVPLAVAGFNYGEFKKKETTIPQLSYALEGYANGDLPDYIKGAASQIGGLSPVRLLDQTLSQADAAMRIYDRFFSHPTYGRIAITQQAEFNFGQSWPGLVYLPISAFFDATQRFQLMGGISKGLTDFIQEVTPHEVSHQWWGHMVGWTSYRDQWLSEGFADFSAGLFLQMSEPKPDKYLKYLETARDAIITKNNFGVSPNDAGPLCMGFRLNTLRTGSAYQRLVYPKGGYVLHMLRSMLWDPQTGDDNFIKLMHDYVATHLYQNASTESFQAVVEKHMTKTMDLTGDGKMDWFFQEWIYGTEVPKYKFDYDLVPEPDGKVRLKASLTQSGVSDTFRMPVTLYVELDGRMVRFGTVPIVGNKTLPNLEAVLPQKSKRVLINANYDVLSQK
jgi:aminopeptidase N